MKNCPSCGSELADDAIECLCGHVFEEGDEAVEESEEIQPPPLDTEAPEESEEVAGEEEEREPEPALTEPALDEFVPGPEVPQTKQCVFCMSEIAAPALRCPHCAGFLPIAEGTIFKQYFFFLFCCLAMAIGTLLPWERSYLFGNLRGIDSIGGGFLLAFSVYGVVVSVWNIYHRKMIVWPAILAAVDGAFIGWTRVVQISKNPEVQQKIADSAANITSQFGQIVTKAKGYVAAYGPGLYLVTIFSSLVILSIFLSVFRGAKEDARKKANERESRAAARAARRGG